MPPREATKPSSIYHRPWRCISTDAVSFLTDAAIDPADESGRRVLAWTERLRHWLKLPSRMSQAHAAVALKRFGRTKDALAIMASLKERSVTDELGMHWNDAYPPVGFGTNPTSSRKR